MSKLTLYRGATLKNPVRLILKKVKIDAHGQLIDSGYKTLDIDSQELESLLFERQPHIRGKFEVVGAELLNEESLIQAHKEDNEIDF